ncbi:WD40 repeat domain-containing protein [Hyunsoonleella ulvae]|uniref:WD40 repeat domain-containing protein n=1 Tax=Hyunsoonleella ulvae TaxID=2799948 RepID=UPI0019395E75|nr:WD40 repeat domain-containing protein [Hyunsoonleella ulvae]
MKKTLLLFFFCSHIYSQNYKKEKNLHKHSAEINSITTTNDFFATSSSDKSVIVWNYKGKKIYEYKIKEGKINTLKFIPKSNILLVATTEKKNKKNKKYFLKSIDIKGNLLKVFIDSTLSQPYVDSLFLSNNKGVLKATSSINNKFTSLNVWKSLNIPSAKNGLSHSEYIQSISISPNNNLIATIDYYRNLKIWDLNGNIIYKSKIFNNKKRTNIFFISNTTLFITPNITLNFELNNLKKIEGYENFMTTPLNTKLYCYFDYHFPTENEKILDIKSGSVNFIDSKNIYSIKTVTSKKYFVNLGADRIVRVRSENGKMLTSFGKTKKESTFLGKKALIKYSDITEIGISPNSDYIISGTKSGKITIWRKQ